MIDIEIGQVLSLRIRYNNSGQIASRKHPYLVISIHEEINAIEIAQMDSLQGKEYKAVMRSNKVIYNDEPVETVIDKDSYIQMDNTILIESFEGIEAYRRQIDKLSSEKLTDVLTAYRNYHSRYRIDENKQVYMTKEELEELNT